MSVAEVNLHKSEDALKRAEERYAKAQTACNALLLKYAQDDVCLHRAVLYVKAN